MSDVPLVNQVSGAVDAGRGEPARTSGSGLHREGAVGDGVAMAGMKLLRATEVGDLVKKSPQSLRGMVRKGALPAPIYIGRTPMWVQDELHSWLCARRGTR